MARLSVLLISLLFSAISLAGVTAEENTELRVGDTGISLTRLIDSEGKVLRERRNVREKKKKNKSKKRAGRRSRKVKNKNKNNNKKKFSSKKKNGNTRNKTRKNKKKRKNNNKRNNKNKNKNKNKKQKKTKKGRKGKKGKRTRQSSCSSSTEVSLTCMTNAMEGMKFEKNQITNYLKQAKRLENHEQISTNKVGKKGEFEEARKHLLWAIGGNIKDPQCGPNSTSEKDSSIDYDYEKTLALKGLTVLANCSVAIEAACNTSKLEGYEGPAFAENIKICRSMMNDAIENSKKCQKMMDSTTEQCNCWANQSVLVQKIKKFSCLAKATQKLITKHKENCKEVFKVCKKEEDASVEAVYSCMNDHSMVFINQSLDSLGNIDSPPPNNSEIISYFQPRPQKKQRRKRGV